MLLISFNFQQAPNSITAEIQEGRPQKQVRPEQIPRSLPQLLYPKVIEQKFKQNLVL